MNIKHIAMISTAWPASVLWCLWFWFVEGKEIKFSGNIESTGDSMILLLILSLYPVLYITAYAFIFMAWVFKSLFKKIVLAADDICKARANHD